MRIRAVAVSNVGGLPDGHIELPAGSIAALAGANGTGKSKLRACILSPWSGQIPAPRNDEVAEVAVDLVLLADEREAVRQLSITMGWGDVPTPENVQIIVRRGPMFGMQRLATPSTTVLLNLWNIPDFFARTPSMNVVYLPAERRLLEPRQQGIDLNQLTEAIAYQKNAESRNAVANYGRLDDQEFEDFAKALCVASTLPADDGSPASAPSSIQWEEFQRTVNTLIAPKELLSLTRSHPDQLRVRTANGDVHSVRDLSSGERQALIIMSRVLRAGSRTPLVLIDEPDAYLHPHLSKRLVLALEDGVGPEGQLIAATHSPAILDGVPPAAILRLEYGSSPRIVADEAERLELYRSAGFRSSALTQSNLLLITEGTTDGTLLSLALPQLSSASIRSPGGKQQVLREVAQLTPFDLPVLGVVDRDVNSVELPEDLKDKVFTWPTADIEGLYLSPDALQAMLDRGLIKTNYEDVTALVALVHDLCMAQRENVIAELARARAVAMSGYEWPSPRGSDALSRLRSAVADARPISREELDGEIERAEAAWEAEPDPLVLVRGKYILSAFATQASEMKSGRALIEAVARSRPPIHAIDELALLVDRQLRAAP